MWVAKLAPWIAVYCWALENPAAAQILGRQEAPRGIIQFNLVAADARGQAIGDLTPDDLRITDNGKPQKIVLFRHSDGKLLQMAPLRQAEFTNRVSWNVPRATVILFDLFNEGLGARGAALGNLVRALTSLESAECLYLYLLTQDGVLYPVHGLPGPATEPAGENGEPWTKNSKALLDRAIHKVYRLRPTEIDIDTRVIMTYRVLGGVAAMLAGIPGRKNLVWITHGVPLVTDIDYTALLEEMSVRFDQSNVAIYPVQQTPPGMSLAAPDRGVESEQTLQRFADLTGGPAKSMGDITQILRQAIHDARSSYLLGFDPPPGNSDGKFHKLKITCARKGVRIQVKTGYFAIDTAGGEQAALDGAVMASFDAAEIEVRGKASNSLAGPTSLHFDFRIDPAAIRFTDEGGRSTAHLLTEIATYTVDGEARHTPLEQVDVRVTADEMPKLMEDWIQLKKDINLKDAVTLRLVVYDKTSRAIGSLTIPVGTAVQ